MGTRHHLVIVGELGVCGNTELVGGRHRAFHDFIDLHLLKAPLTSNAAIFSKRCTHACWLKGLFIITTPRFNHATFNEIGIRFIAKWLAKRHIMIEHWGLLLFLDLCGTSAGVHV